MRVVRRERGRGKCQVEIDRERVERKRGCGREKERGWVRGREGERAVRRGRKRKKMFGER